MENTSDEAQTVGKGDYIVQEGDCMSSIADATGHFWQTLWELSDNEELKQTRKDPNILLPGDRVTIPELREKEESISVENRHRFKRSGVPAKLRICVTHLDQPLTSEPYILDVEGNKIEGETDEDGFLEEFIACNAKKAILKVGKADHQLVYSLNLGVTVPSNTIRGVKQRLHNLGYNCGPIDNTWDMQAQEATCEFQAANDLEITGELDEDTRNLLQQEYGA